MGVGSLTTATTGTPIPANDHNIIVAALKGDIVPRNGSGVAEADAGDMGTSSLPFKRAHITSGGWVCGDVKMFHDFNGSITPGQGWMKLNGDVVSEANYNAIHGAGSWATYVVSSPLSGKNLPNMNDKYVRGATVTAQDGSAPITTVGNADHEVDLSHTHTGPSHNHQWYQRNGSSSDEVYNSVGTQTVVTSNGKGIGESSISSSSASGSGPQSAYTSNAGTGNTGTGGSAAQNVEPEAHELQFWIRII